MRVFRQEYTWLRHTGTTEKNISCPEGWKRWHKKAEVIIKRAFLTQDMHRENAGCVKLPDKTTAAEENRAAKAVWSMNTARRQDKGTAVLWKGRIWMQTSFCCYTTEKGWGEGIFHTLFWEKLAEKYRKNIRYMTEYPEGQLNQEEALLWNFFIPDWTDRKAEIHRKWQAGNQKRVSGFVFICKMLKNVFCRYFMYLFEV